MATIPNASERPLDARGYFTRPWLAYLRELGLSGSDDEINAALAEIRGRIAALEEHGAGIITGPGSVRVSGTLENGVVQLTLRGDDPEPGETYFYGTDDEGVKGWHLLGDSFDTDTLAKTVDADTGIVSFDLEELADAGGGTFKLLTRDDYGRLSGTSDGDTDDVPEGSTNLYFTAARVRAVVLTGLSTATNAVIAATDTVLQAFGKLQAQITALASTVSGLVVSTITDGDTTHAPSGDAVHAALKFSGALVALDANQAIPDSSGTYLSFGTETYDEGGYFSAGAPTRLTVSEDGVYVISASCVFAGNATGYRQLQLFKNGASYAGRPLALQPAVSGIATGISVDSAATYCVAGDYFEAQVTQTSGGALNVLQNNATWFAIRKIANH